MLASTIKSHINRPRCRRYNRLFTKRQPLSKSSLKNTLSMHQSNNYECKHSSSPLAAVSSTSLSQIIPSNTKAERAATIIDNNNNKRINDTTHMEYTELEQAITRGAEWEKKLLCYFASPAIGSTTTTTTFSSTSFSSSSSSPSPSHELTSSVNSLLPITGTTLAWQMHTAFHADVITRLMLFPQRTSNNNIITHTPRDNDKTHTTTTTVNIASDKHLYSSQERIEGNKVKDDKITPINELKNDRHPEQLTNLNSILRNVLCRKNVSSTPHTTLQESGYFRMLDSRFTNETERQKDLTNAEVPFVKLLHDLQRIWSNAVSAHNDIQSLKELFASSQILASSEEPELENINRTTLSDRVIFLILYAHQRHSCGVAKHMMDIAEKIKLLINNNNNNMNANNSNTKTIKNNSSINTNYNKCYKSKSMCDINSNVVLKVITIIIGFEPIGLTSSGNDEKQLVNAVNNSCYNLTNFEEKGEELADTLCYSHAGAYTLNGILQIIKSLTNTKCENKSSNNNNNSSSVYKNRHRKLQKRIFILSESWLTSRSLAAMYYSSNLPTCTPTNKFLTGNKCLGNSEKEKKIKKECDMTHLCENLTKNSWKGNFVVDHVGDDTTIEVLPAVISNSLSKLEKDAFARYLFCRIID